ncbi:hypothetical protein [Sphingomonas sp. R647]|uniref:hypothetical protein n=1 Tax=Sphingomonas sp. R647 TaxID=2875233 RepID=UPI001CD7BA45|nr:hypothetical protein [Sphingomonas sp. R647]
MRLSSRLRGLLSRAAHVIAAMLLGAYALAKFLEWSDPTFRHALDGIEAATALPCFLFTVVGSALDPTPRPRSKWSGRLNPDYSGSVALAVIGLSAALILWRVQIGDQGLTMPIVIVVVTIIGTVAAWRFAKVRGAEIGEARFTQPSELSSSPRA